VTTELNHDPDATTTGTTVAIECADVGVRIGSADIVEHVDLSVAAGDWVTVIGPNGAGKSTLLRALLGLVPYTGVVRLSGVDATRLSPLQRARRVAFVAQSPVVPDRVRVLDYVLLGRTPHLPRGLAIGGDDIRIATAVLQRLGLETLADRQLDTLSGGERQRVFVARALAQDAPVLLLDEPTTSLDIGHQQEVLELVDDLRADAGLAVITTLHDLTLAGQYTDRLVLLADGRVVASGSPRDVLDHELLWHHYGAQVEVIDDGEGVIVIPRRRKERS